MGTSDCHIGIRWSCWGFGGLGRAGSRDRRPFGGKVWLLCFESSTLSQSASNLAMDAADEREVKLQRASGDLVAEFSTKLPLLLWKTRTLNGREVRVGRRWAPAAKTERLVGLVWQPITLVAGSLANLLHSAGTFSRVAAVAGPSSAEAASSIG
jgi:hypothetical protein